MSDVVRSGHAAIRHVQEIKKKTKVNIICDNATKIKWQEAEKLQSTDNEKEKEKSMYKK